MGGTEAAAHRACMHVVLLAHYFPPDGGPGAQRPIAFVRHLPACGARVTVLTRQEPARRGPFEPRDAAVADELAQRARLVRAAIPPGADLASSAAALAATGRQVLRDDPPDVVLATMSPFELAEPALQLGAHFGVPVALDLRDPWAFDGVQDHRSHWHWRRAVQRMLALLAASQGVIANTAESGRLFRAALPGPVAVTTIPNGFEPADFAGPAPQVPVGEQLELLHAGSFLCGELYAHERLRRRLTGWLRHRAEPLDPAGRTPAPLLAAIARLRASGHPAGTAVRLRCVGMVDPALQRCVAASGVADAVVLQPYAPHHELIAAMRRADALFLTLHGLPAGHRARIVPGKTYEYLASGRPILAGLPAGDARDLVAGAPHSFLAEPNDPVALAERLVALHTTFRTGSLATASFHPELARYARPLQVAALAAFLRCLPRPRRSA